MTSFLIGTTEITGNLVQTESFKLTTNPSIGNVLYCDNDGYAAWGAPNTLSPYLVGYGCDYTTIQAAINAASAEGGGNIYVKPNTYIEDLTLADNINIIGFNATPPLNDSDTNLNNVFITGAITFATGTIKTSMQNVSVSSSINDLFTFNSAATTQLFLYGCNIYITTTNNVKVFNYEFNGTNPTIILNRCSIDTIKALFSAATPTSPTGTSLALTILNSNITSSVASSIGISATINIQNSTLSNSITFSGDTTTTTFNNSDFYGNMTYSGATSNTLRFKNGNYTGNFVLSGTSTDNLFSLRNSTLTNLNISFGASNQTIDIFNSVLNAAILLPTATSSALINIKNSSLTTDFTSSATTGSITLTLDSVVMDGGTLDINDTTNSMSIIQSQMSSITLNNSANLTSLKVNNSKFSGIVTDLSTTAANTLTFANCTLPVFTLSNPATILRISNCTDDASDLIQNKLNEGGFNDASYFTQHYSLKTNVSTIGPQTPVNFFVISVPAGKTMLINMSINGTTTDEASVCSGTAFGVFQFTGGILSAIGSVDYVKKQTAAPPGEEPDFAFLTNNPTNGDLKMSVVNPTLASGAFMLWFAQVSYQFL